MRPLRTLSAYVSPAGDHLVAVLKAYFDDSGDASADTESHLTIGGFVGDEDGWQHFEPRWDALMRDSGVPYFHMKEFGNPKSEIYGHIKTDKDREAEFVGSMAKLIRESVQGSVAATVSLDDLRAFNAKHGLELDAYAIAIYACLCKLRQYYPAGEVEIIFDKFDNSTSRAAKGWKYAVSDTSQPIRPDLFTPVMLQKDESWRNVLPLQAADYCVWEVRKFRRERAGFRPSDEYRDDPDLMFLSQRIWEQKNKPRDRLSFQAIRNGMIFRPLHVVIDDYLLRDALARHPNGWGDS